MHIHLGNRHRCCTLIGDEVGLAISGSVLDIRPRCSEPRPNSRPDRLLGWRHRHPVLFVLRQSAFRGGDDLIQGWLGTDAPAGAIRGLGAFCLHDHSLDEQHDHLRQPQRALRGWRFSSAKRIVQGAPGSRTLMQPIGLTPVFSVWQPPILPPVATALILASALSELTGFCLRSIA